MIGNDYAKTPLNIPVRNRKQVTKQTDCQAVKKTITVCWKTERKKKLYSWLSPILSSKLLKIIS